MLINIFLKLHLPFIIGLSSVTSQGERQNQMLRSFPVYRVPLTYPVVNTRSESEI